MGITNKPNHVNVDSNYYAGENIFDEALSKSDERLQDRRAYRSGVETSGNYASSSRTQMDANRIGGRSYGFVERQHNKLQVLAGFGRLVSYATDDPSRPGQKQTVVLFQNGSRLLIPIYATRAGDIRLRGREAVFIDADGREQNVKISEVEGATGQVRFEFSDSLTFYLNFTIEGQKDYERVVLANSQSLTTFPTDCSRFTVRTRAWPQTQVLHTQALGPFEQRSYFDEGTVLRYRTYFSDGHILEYALDQNKDGTKVRVRRMALFYPDQEETVSLHNNVRPRGTVTGRSGAQIELRVNGRSDDASEGLDLQIAVQLPQRMQRHIEVSGVTVLGMPMHETALSPDLVLSAEDSVFDPDGVFNLIPTTASARLMANPPLSSTTVTLEFYGELGDRRVSEESPLAVTGYFVDGEFIPTTRTRRGVFLEARSGDDNRDSVQYVVNTTPDGLVLRVFTQTGRPVEVDANYHVHLFGFCNEAGDERDLQDIFREHHLEHPEDWPNLDHARWQDANEQIFREVSRFVALDITGGVSIMRDRPEIVRVETFLGHTFLFRRSEDGDQIVYTMYGQTAADQNLSTVSLGTHAETTLEELLATDEHDEVEIVTPWLGSLESTDPETEVPSQFRHPILPVGVFWDDNDGTLNFEIPRELSTSSRRGVFLDTNALEDHFDGQEREARVVLDNGDHLLLRFSRNFADDLTPLDVLSGGPQRVIVGGRDLIQVDYIDVNGDILSDAGRITRADGSNNWQITFPESEVSGWNGLRVALLEEGHHFGLEFFDASVGVEPVSVSTPPPTQGPATIPPTLPLLNREADPFGASQQPAPRDPARNQGLPWVDDAVLLPTPDTQVQMRRIANQAGSLRTGEVVVFDFVSEESEDGYRVAYAAPFRFDGTNWVPHRRQAYPLQARILDASDQTLAKWSRPVEVVEASLGRTGLRVGNQEHEVLEIFRVPLEVNSGGEFVEVPSPDFALAMGPVTEVARETLSELERTTSAADIYQTTTALVSVPRFIGAEHVGQMPVHFYDPLYRTPRVGDFVTEVSPGLTEQDQAARYGRVRIYNAEATIDVNLIFQQDAEAVQLAAVRVFGTDIPIDADHIVQDGDEFTYTATLPTSYDLLGTSRQGRYTLPVTITWTVANGGSAISVRSALIGDGERIDFNNLEFDVSTMTDAEITRTRRARSVSVSQARGSRPRRTEANITRATGDLLVRMPQNINGQNIGLEAARLALVTGVLDSQTLADAFWMGYDFPTPEGANQTLEVLVRFNPDRGWYEPVLRAQRAQLRMPREGGGVQTLEVPCERNTSAHGQWVLQYGSDEDQVLFFANYTIDGSLDTGHRPLPMFWRTGTPNPNRSRVVRELNLYDLSPDAAAVQTLPEESDSEQIITVTIQNGEETIQIPMREEVSVNLSGGRMVVPVGPAQRSVLDTDLGSMPVTYYQPHLDRLGVIGLADGRYFEVSIRGRSGRGHGRYIQLTPVHPGEAAVLTPARARRSLVINDDGASALLLYDLQAGVVSLQEQYEALTAVDDDADTTSGEDFLRRTLRDSITHEEYEVVFRVVRNPIRGDELEMVGIARLLPLTETDHSAGRTQRAVEVVPASISRNRGRTFLYLPGRHEYLSFAHSLRGSGIAMQSHGPDLGDGVVERLPNFTNLNPSPDVFSGLVHDAPPEAASRSSVNDWDHEANRARAVNEVFTQTGVDPRLLWPVLIAERTRSAIRVEHVSRDLGAMSGLSFQETQYPTAGEAIWEIGVYPGSDQTPRPGLETPYVRWRGQDLNFEMITVLGIRMIYLVDWGVVLSESYNGWGSYRGTDFLLLEELERVFYGEASPRSKGSSEYPSQTEPEVVEAREIAVARAVMRGFFIADVLPGDLPEEGAHLAMLHVDWRVYADLVIPDRQTFTVYQPTLHLALGLLLQDAEGWNEDGRHTADVRAIFVGLQDGRFTQEGAVHLIEAVMAYREWLATDDSDKINRTYQHVQTEIDYLLGRKTPADQRLSPRDALWVYPLNHQEVYNTLLQIFATRDAGLLAATRETYPYLLTHNQDRQITFPNLMEWRNGTREYVGGYRYVNFNGPGALEAFDDFINQTNARDPLPVALEVALYLEFGHLIYRRARIEEASVEAAVEAAVERVIAAQRAIHNQLATSQNSPLPDAPVFGESSQEREQLEQMIAEGMIPAVNLLRQQTMLQDDGEDIPPAPPQQARDPNREAPVIPFYNSLFPRNVRTVDVAVLSASPDGDGFTAEVHDEGFGRPKFNFTIQTRLAQSGQVEMRLVHAYAQSGRENLPVHFYDDGRFIVGGYGYQLIVDSETGEPQALHTTTSANRRRAENASYNVAFPIDQDESSPSRWIAVKGVQDTPSHDVRDWHGNTATGGAYQVIGAHVDRDSFEAGQVLLFVMDEGWEEARNEALAAGHPFMVAQNLQVARDAFEESHPHLAHVFGLGLTDVEHLDGAAWYQRQQHLAREMILNEQVATNGEYYFEIYHALLGFEIAPEVWEMALNTTHASLYNTLNDRGLIRPGFFPDDLGEWFLNYEWENPADLTRFMHVLRQEDIDLFEHPEQAAYYLFLVELQRQGVSWTGAPNPQQFEGGVVHARILTTTSPEHPNAITRATHAELERREYEAIERREAYREALAHSRRGR